MNRPPEALSRLAQVLTVTAWACVALCIGLLLWGLNRGFDLTDEGFCVLVCNQPEHYPLLATGFNRLIAPVTELTGKSVIALRLLRLGWLLVMNLAFVLAFQNWLARVWPAVYKASRGWMVPVMLLGVPAGYLWAPQSPSYNDVVGGAGLGGMTALLLSLSLGSSISGLPARTWVGLFFVGVSLTLVAIAKPPACISAALLYSGMVLVGLRGYPWHKRLLALLTMTAGLGASLFLLQVTCLDVKGFFRSFLEVARVIAQGSHPPTKLLGAYAQQLATSLSSLLRHFGWAGLLFFLLPELLTRRRPGRWRGDTWLVPGAILLGVVALGTRLDHFRGANHTASAVQSWWLVLGLAAALAGGGWWRQRALLRPQPGVGINPVGLWPAPEVWGIAAGLFLLPLALAGGTSGHLLMPAVYLAGAWFGVLTLAVGTAMRQRVARPAAALCLLLLLTLVLTQFLYGYLSHPYRLAASLTRQTEQVKGLSKANGLLFDAPSAAFLSSLASAYQQARPDPAQPILALYDVPGLVFLLGGGSPVTPWLSDTVESRSLVLGSLAAYGKELRHGASLPFLLLNEELDKEMLYHLQQNGIPFPEGYSRIVSLTCPWDGRRTELWVPRAGRGSPRRRRLLWHR